MDNDFPKIFRVPKFKQILLITSSAILFSLGTIPSIFVTYEFGSILPLLGGILLGFFAYALFVKAKVSLVITPEELIIAEPWRKKSFYWDDICEFYKGEGIDRYKVRIKLTSEPPPLEINLGLVRIQCKNIRYLPSTFGMKASDLTELLNKIKRNINRKKQLV
ncbi:MAG: hypothetical protein JW715_12175 [Sedimentisphaerales bacterium]|nr:hypothetical protein [Sedimentisphaerales bacterium]